MRRKALSSEHRRWFAHDVVQQVKKGERRWGIVEIVAGHERRVRVAGAGKLHHRQAQALDVRVHRVRLAADPLRRHVRHCPHPSLRLRDCVRQLPTYSKICNFNGAPSVD